MFAFSYFLGAFSNGISRSLAFLSTGSRNFVAFSMLPIRALQAWHRPPEVARNWKVAQTAKEQKIAQWQHASRAAYRKTSLIPRC